jgi:deoxyribose-phosphate aldolase
MQNIASYIDHTYLKPDANAAVIERLCREGLRYGFRSVCVNGEWVKLCSELLRGSSVGVSAVCGFPLGAMATAAKAFEAELAAGDGASEIDMVMQIGPFLDGRFAQVEADIAAVVRAVQGQAVVKVILETGYLTDRQIVDACKLAEQAGARFVKTSTGFGPGQATAHHVKLMREAVSESVLVKASGGIRDYQTAVAMIEAGAARIGTSSGVAIMNSGQGADGY